MDKNIISVRHPFRFKAIFSDCFCLMLMVCGLALVNVEGAIKSLGIATGVIGGLNTIATGIDRQHRFKEIGNRYRITSEEIKGHIRLLEADLIDFVEFSRRYEATKKKDLELFKEDAEEMNVA